MLLVELITIIIGLISVRNQKIGRLFIFYTFFDVLILLLAFYLASHNSPIKSKFSSYTNSLIAAVELTVYYFFFFKVLNNQSVKKLLKVLLLAYIALLSFFLATRFSFLTNRFSYVSYVLNTIEFLFILPPCLVFFFEIVNTESKLNLLERPSFWIVTGIFFYALISIPYYLLSRYIDISHFKFKNVLGATLFNIPYAINFLFLIKAFLCKKNLTI